MASPLPVMTRSGSIKEELPPVRGKIVGDLWDLAWERERRSWWPWGLVGNVSLWRSASARIFILFDIRVRVYSF